MTDQYDEIAKKQVLIRNLCRENDELKKQVDLYKSQAEDYKFQVKGYKGHNDFNEEIIDEYTLLLRNLEKRDNGYKGIIKSLEDQVKLYESGTLSHEVEKHKRLIASLESRIVGFKDVVVSFQDQIDYYKWRIVSYEFER